MCRPTHFAVTYRINPWMDPAAPYDTARAVAQWETLRRTYLELGTDPQLRELARSIITSQDREISIMTELLAERGASPNDS